MLNAAGWSAMPQYEEQGCGMTRNAAEQRTTPQLEEQRHSIPLHGKNATAQCTMQPPMQWHDAQCSCTLWQQEEWRRQWQHQQQHNGDANNDTKPLPHSLILPSPQKSLIKLDYFCIFNCHWFFPFWKVSGVLAPARLFWVSWCHHCPWWLKPVDCFVKVFC